MEQGEQDGNSSAFRDLNEEIFNLITSGGKIPPNLPAHLISPSKLQQASSSPSSAQGDILGSAQRNPPMLPQQTPVPVQDTYQKQNPLPQIPKWKQRLEQHHKESTDIPTPPSSSPSPVVPGVEVPGGGYVAKPHQTSKIYRSLLSKPAPVKEDSNPAWKQRRDTYHAALGIDEAAVVIPPNQINTFEFATIPRKKNSLGVFTPSENGVPGSSQISFRFGSSNNGSKGHIRATEKKPESPPVGLSTKLPEPKPGMIKISPVQKQLNLIEKQKETPSFMESMRAALAANK